MSSRGLLGNCKVLITFSQLFFNMEVAILRPMRRVNGVKKNAEIILAGFIAGLIIWFQVMSSSANAAAFKENPSVALAQKPKQYVLSAPTRVPSPVPTVMAFADSVPSPPDKAEVLTTVQLQRLYDVSRKYIAQTPADGNRVARSLNIIKDDGDPTNICGPLSIAILRDARLIDPYISLREFWLLNPDISRKLLDQTFPPERYTHFHFTTQINEMDWSTFPLKPGDFIYLYAGPGGTFEHMLTVTRVDESGRTYSVTNHATPGGFVIDEVMLYDPSQPGVGQFYKWTDRKNKGLGSTGFGGFELWRLKQPVIDKSPRELAFAQDLDAMMSQYGGEWYVAIKQVGGGMIYDRRAGDLVEIGSMVKIPVAMLFFKSLETAGIRPEQYSEYLSREGPNRTYAQLLRAMIVHSEYQATKDLLQATRDNGLDVDAVLSQWGLKDARLDSRKLSVDDLVALYEGLYSGGLINQEARNYILTLMAEGASGATTRLGVLQKTNPLSLRFYNRRGSTLDTVVAIGDSALVSVPVVDGEDTYIVVMFGYYRDDMPTTDQGLISAIEGMAQIFWAYTKK